MEHHGRFGQFEYARVAVSDKVGTVQWFIIIN